MRNENRQQSLGLPFKCDCGEKKDLLNLCSEIWPVFIIREDWALGVPFCTLGSFLLSHLTHTLHFGNCCSQSTSCEAVGGSCID